MQVQEEKGWLGLGLGLELGLGLVEACAGTGREGLQECKLVAI